MSDQLKDSLQRPFPDLRISVTDRCNFRCTYCMPKEIFGRNYEFLPSSQILRFEEIARLTRILVAHGVGKIRFTGGEPLLRRQIEKLIAMIAALEGLEDVTLTTNGSTLASKAGALREAGLRRITVSLDSLDDEVFARMNDVDFPVQRVLEGIEAARVAGLTPIKINMMVQRGVNDRSVVPMARHFHGSGHIVRFIEYMDVGSSNHWKLDEVVPGSEILSAIHAEMPLEPVQPSRHGEVARRYRYQDGGGEIGVITSVTQPFCGDCNRLRLSSEGELYTCLFASSGHDLRAMIRGGSSDEEISDHIAGIWKAREDRYSETRSSATPNLPKVEMSHIGG